MAKFNSDLIATMKNGNAKKVYINEDGAWLFYPREGYKAFSRAEVCGEVDSDSDSANDNGSIDYSKKSVKELTAILEEKGIEIPEGAKKADLVALLVD